MSHHDSPPPASIHVAGIGNALVDVLASAPEELIDELGLVKGVGPAKLAAYGEDFLKIILAHAGEPALGATTEPFG